MTKQKTRRVEKKTAHKVPNLSEDQLLLHPEVAVIDNGHFHKEYQFIYSEDEMDINQLPSLLHEIVCIIVSSSFLGEWFLWIDVGGLVCVKNAFHFVGGVRLPDEDEGSVHGESSWLFGSICNWRRRQRDLSRPHQLRKALSPKGGGQGVKKTLGGLVFYYR